MDSLELDSGSIAWVLDAVLTPAEVVAGWGVSRHRLRRALDKGRLDYRVTAQGITLITRVSIVLEFGSPKDN